MNPAKQFTKSTDSTCQGLHQWIGPKATLIGRLKAPVSSQYRANQEILSYLYKETRKIR